MEGPESLEALQARHRKEQRDLVSRVTQKKKAASKKTRKGVNDECDRLEQELKERQAQELATINGNASEAPAPESEGKHDQEKATHVNGDDIVTAVDSLEISPPTNGAGSPTTDAEPVSATSAGPKKKQNRAKARLARRAAEQDAIATQAAEEVANLPDAREVERMQMQDLFAKHGLQEKEIRADGHCLYAAVADQMYTQLGLELKPSIEPTINREDIESIPAYKQVRHAAADFIMTNSDDFVPFMEEPLGAYLQKIRETGEWGGHMELMALAKTYGVSINVLHADGRVDKIEPEESGTGEKKEIWLGYYKHNFGLGEHYNSLRKPPLKSTIGRNPAWKNLPPGFPSSYDMER